MASVFVLGGVRVVFFAAVHSRACTGAVFSKFLAPRRDGGYIFPRSSMVVVLYAVFRVRIIRAFRNVGVATFRRGRPLSYHSIYYFRLVLHGVGGHL